MQEQDQGRYDAQRVRDLIHDIPFAMFTTATADGSLRSRPMVASDNSFDGAMWFFTRASSPVAQEINGQGHVNVTYVSAPEDRFVSVSGSADVVRNVERARQMWAPSYAAWFAGGPEDAELAMIRITVTRLEYWDRKLGRMQTL